MSNILHSFTKGNIEEEIAQGIHFFDVFYSTDLSRRSAGSPTDLFAATFMPTQSSRYIGELEKLVSNLKPGLVLLNPTCSNKKKYLFFWLFPPVYEHITVMNSAFWIVWLHWEWGHLASMAGLHSCPRAHQEPPQQDLLHWCVQQVLLSNALSLMLVGCEFTATVII